MPVKTQKARQRQHQQQTHQQGSTQLQAIPRQSLAPSRFDSLKATNVLPHGYFTASALMRSISGTIFPPATGIPTSTPRAGTEQEDIDYDDEDEDSPASTIVPSSPNGSRRNSLVHDGVITEEAEDITLSSGDGMGSRVAYEHIDREDGKVNHVDSQSKTGGLHSRLQSHARNARIEQHGTTPRTAKPPASNLQTKSKPSRPVQQQQTHHEIPQTESQIPAPTVSASKLHPRVAVILGVDRKWYLPLVICRAMSVGPALWWGLRCAFTFLAELLRIRPGSMWREGWVAIVVSSAAADWDVERRFRVTEVALAIVWCCASAYLSYFFMDCMMSRWLLNYSPPAVLIRLLATNGLIAYLTSSVLWLSGASSDPRLLLPAWISITTTLTFLYHATQNHAMIKRETTASISVLSVASYVSMSLILLQLHLTRDNEPEVPAFVMGQKVLEWLGGLTSSFSVPSSS